MKRISIFVLFCVLVFTAGAAWADNNTTKVAKYNNTEYDKLASAVAAAKDVDGAEIQLIANTQENVLIAAKNITLDLNGHTLTGIIGNDNNGNLTIINKADNKGTISPSSGGPAIIARSKKLFSQNNENKFSETIKFNAITHFS